MASHGHHGPCHNLPATVETHVQHVTHTMNHYEPQRLSISTSSSTGTTHGAQQLLFQPMPANLLRIAWRRAHSGSSAGPGR